MSDSRISVYIDVDTWVLVLMKVSAADEATYECHVNSDPPRKLAIHLIVEGINSFNPANFISNLSPPISVPVMKVMDGFGRHLQDQYYKAGSSLEVVCEVNSAYWKKSSLATIFQLDSVPFFWNSTDISQLLIWKQEQKVVTPAPKDGIRCGPCRGQP